MTEDDEVPRPPDILTAVEDMCRDVVRELAYVLKNIRDGKLGEAKTAGSLIRDLRAAFMLAMEERSKVEKIRKHEAGIVNGYGLDLERARDEIARRLDRIGRTRAD